MPIGYAASEQLIRQRIQKETKEKYLEKEAKKRKKEKSKLEKETTKAEQEAANNTSQQKKNFRQSAQHQEVVATKKTAIQETGSKRSFAIGGRYYHSRTCLPMSKKIFKREDKSYLDSDDDDKEQEEMWDEEDALYIDEYVDVAQVEKDFFRMWNKHVRKYCVMANRQMPDLHEFVHVRSQGDFGKRPSDEEVVSFTLDEHVRIWRVVWKGDSSARGENGRFQMRVGRKKNSYPNAPFPTSIKKRRKKKSSCCRHHCCRCCCCFCCCCCCTSSSSS